MNLMLITVKNIQNRCTTYDLEPYDTIKMLVSKIIENDLISHNKTIKIIYNGQILSHDKNLSEFQDDNITLVYIVEKNKTNKKEDLVIREPIPVNNEVISTLDEIDKLRSLVAGTMVFIRSSPQLVDLFINNFDILLNIIASPQIKPLFEKMISENPSGDSKYLEELTKYIYEMKFRHGCINFNKE